MAAPDGSYTVPLNSPVPGAWAKTVLMKRPAAVIAKALRKSILLLSCCPLARKCWSAAGQSFRPIHQGLRNRRMSRSSCWLSEARTRIWRRIVPEIRGEKPCGASWHREQFCLNFFSPSPSCPTGACAFPGRCCAAGCGSCEWGAESAGRARRTPSADISATIRICIFISLSMLGIGIDIRSRSPTH
jgi:hypothetical protein